jgi:acetyl esterase/lipase
LQIFNDALRARRSSTFAMGLMLTAALILIGCGSTVEPSGSPSPTPIPTATPTAPPITPPPAIVTPAPTPIEPVPTPETPGPPVSFAPPCGEADPTCSSLNVRLRQNVDYTDLVPCGVDRPDCLLKVDAFALDGGSDRPIVVMIPGGPLPPGNRETMWALARYVAGRGAVVFTADYRSARTYGGGYPNTFADIACAIRFARQMGAELGGDPARVTLVAHSFGGFPATVVALASHDYATDEPACLAKQGDGRPEAFVGVAGVYTLDRIGQDFLADFLGGDRSTAPDAWAAADAATLVEDGGRIAAPVRLIVGTNDFVAPMTTADELVAILEDGSRDVAVTTVLDGTHDSVLRDVVTVDVVSQLAAKGPLGP